MDSEELAVANEDASERQNPETAVIREGSMKFSLYPARTRPSSSKGATKSSPTSSFSTMPSMPSTTHPDSFSKNSRAGSRHGMSQRSPNDSYRTGASPVPHNKNIRHIPSEASKLRVLNSGYGGQTVDGRPSHEAHQPENFSRPRKPSMRNSEDSQTVQYYASVFPLHSQDESVTNSLSRDRGISVSSSSSRSTSAFPALTIRPSMSIPDLNASETIYSGQRNFTSFSQYQSRRGHTTDSYTSHLREPPLRPSGFDGEEVRASFRSALTTGSSLLETNGTERSSVMTKSSSTTSIFGRDDGFSVDDAIGMYENGFTDSGVDDGYASRPDTSLSHRSDQIRLPHRRDDSLQVPGKITVCDSNAFFQEPMDFRSLDGNSESVSTPRRIISGDTNIQPSRLATKQSTRPFDNTRDRYGFRKKSQNVSLEQWEAWNLPYEEYTTRRKKKWLALMKECSLLSDDPASFPAKSAKVKRFVRKGIPADWRGAAWFWYAGGPAMVEKHPGLYHTLLQKALNGDLSPTDGELIERDLNRTFPDNIRFKPDPILSNNPESGRASDQTIPMPETALLQSLRRVLQAFAIYNPRIGYCQSLNFLAGLLLLFMCEENSFWLLNIITRVYLPGTHEVNLEGANVDLGVLMYSVKESMPSIWAKIGGELDGSPGDNQVSMRLPPITLCCTSWFMSCFIGNLPIETTLRVWDSFFYEGSKTLFRIALAIFKVGETEIRAVSDPMEIFQVVQTIPRRLIDANTLMEACFKRRNGFGHLSQETIEARRAERREWYAEERRAKVSGISVPVVRKNTLFRRRGRREL